MGKKTAIILLLTFSVFYIIYSLSVNAPTFENLRVLGTVGLIQYLISVYSSLKNGQRLISPYIVFLTVLYIFQAGQSLMYPFYIISKRDLVGFFDITIRDVFNAQVVTFLFLAFFQIGSLICKIGSKIYEKSIQTELYQKKRLIEIGWFLAIISIYPYYQELIQNAILSMLRGYGALYEGEEKIGIANIQSIIADYFIPSMVCLYIGYRKKKSMRAIITSVLLINSAIILVTGGRTEAVIIMALLLILRNYFVRRYNKKELSLIGAGAVMVLVLLAGISQMRGNTSRHFEDTFSISNEGSSNGVVDAIGEMGGSMFCQIWTADILSKSKDYRYGSTYAYALTSVIPNLGFWSIHPAKENANMGDWLTQKKGFSFGTGYSMVAEAYINYWMFGAFLMLFLGFGFTKIFGMLGKAISGRNLAFTVFIMVFFWFSLKLPRNSFIGAVRAIFYFALPIYWYTRGYIVKRNKL